MLKKKYERWQPRARYKQCLDPTLDDIKKICVSMRRNAKKERILFHYNGRGVPFPTKNNEIWVFNKVNFLFVYLSLFLFVFNLFLLELYSIYSFIYL